VSSRALTIPATAVKLPKCRVPEVITQEPGGWLERLEQSEPRFGALPLGNGDRSIQRIDGRRSDGFEHLIETRDLAPTCRFVGRRETVLSGDRGFGVIPREDLGLKSARDVLDIVAQYYPANQIPVKTQYLIEGLFEGAV
jgi:hypothetical protein